MIINKLDNKPKTKTNIINIKIKVNINEQDYIINYQNKKNKNITLLVDRNMNIIVRGYNLTQKRIVEFFTKHLDWVNTKLNKHQSKNNTLEVEKIKSGEIVWLFGNKLKIVNDNSISKHIIDNNKLFISDRLDYKEIINCLFDDYIHLIEDIIEKYKKIFNKNPIIYYKDMYSKYGYCEYKHNRIVFSKRLIHLSLEAIEYVIVHEFCHFYVPNHSKDFYNLLEKYLPDYKKTLKWIKDHSIIIRY